MNENTMTAKELVNAIRNVKNPTERKSFSLLLEKLDIDPIASNDDLTGSKVRGFSLEGKKYDAESHIDVLRKILKIVSMKFPHDMDKIISIQGPRKKCFSKDSKDLRMPEQIRGTTIYFETNDNAMTICVRCEKILKLFGMDYTTFEIDYYK